MSCLNNDAWRISLTLNMYHGTQAVSTERLVDHASRWFEVFSHDISQFRITRTTTSQELESPHLTSNFMVILISNFMVIWAILSPNCGNLESWLDNPNANFSLFTPNMYTAGHGGGILWIWDVNWYVLQSWYNSTYSAECQTLFYVDRE